LLISCNTNIPYIKKVSREIYAKSHSSLFYIFGYWLRRSNDPEDWLWDGLLSYKSI